MGPGGGSSGSPPHALGMFSSALVILVMLKYILNMTAVFFFQKAYKQECMGEESVKLSS